MRFVSFLWCYFFNVHWVYNISKLQSIAQNRLMWQNFMAVLPRLTPTSSLNSYFFSSYKFIVWSEPYLCMLLLFHLLPFSPRRHAVFIIIIILKIVTFIMIITPFFPPPIPPFQFFHIWTRLVFFHHLVHCICYVLEKKYKRFKDETRMHDAIGNGDKRAKRSDMEKRKMKRSVSRLVAWTSE